MKRRIIICTCFALILFSLTVMDTYGLFETEGASRTVYEVGKWEILLNGEDVTLDRDITLNDFVYTGDSHTEPGYLAPGGSAVLDLTLDASSCDTALSYLLTIDGSAIKEFPNLKMQVTDLDNNTILDELTISGNIMLDDASKKRNLKIELVWDDVLEEDENDINVIYKNISFPISMHFSQISEE